MFNLLYWWSTNCFNPRDSTENKKIFFNEASIGLIIINYLQLMQNFKSPIDNRVQELSQITRSLKIIAREFSVLIIALSQ